MVRKDETPNMVESFAEFKALKNIDKATMVSVLEDSFRSALTKMFDTDANIDVIMNPDKGDVQIFQNFEVVPDGEVTKPNLQISLSDARADDDPDVEIGEDHTKEIFITDFGRRAILILRQTLQTKILDMQKKAIYEKFKVMEGELVSGEVYQTWSRETLLQDDEKNDLFLSKSESIPGDFFRKGEHVWAVIHQVDNQNNNPKLYVSRTSETFLRRLFERDIPEVMDGLVHIRAIARIPGERAKIAVESMDDRIDPVGTCVGIKGSRIHGIVRELHNENIDVIQYTSNPSLFIQRALSPARIKSIHLDEDEKRAEVFLEPDQVSLAIGKGGLNIKLASKLTGYTIDVFRDSPADAAEEEDIYLDEFKDEIDGWVIDALKDMGCITAKSVLKTPRQELIDKADLEEDTVDEVIRILAAEFEDEADAPAEAEAPAEAPAETEPEAETPAEPEAEQ